MVGHMGNPITEAIARLLGRAQPEDTTPGPVSRNDAEETQAPFEDNDKN